MSYALNKWSCLEERMHLVCLFAPDGPLQAYRKLMSYDGAISGQDLGNWTYSTSLKVLAHHFDSRLHPYTQVVTTWNDELNGDIIEAILGLVPFLRSPGSCTIRAPEVRSVICRHLPSEYELQLYTGVMAEAVTQVKLVCGDLAHRGVWQDSTATSHFLC